MGTGSSLPSWDGRLSSQGVSRDWRISNREANYRGTNHLLPSRFIFGRKILCSSIENISFRQHCTLTRTHDQSKFETHRHVRSAIDQVKKELVSKKSVAKHVKASFDGPVHTWLCASIFGCVADSREGGINVRVFSL